MCIYIILYIYIVYIHHHTPMQLLQSSSGTLPDGPAPAWFPTRHWLTFLFTMVWLVRTTGHEVDPWFIIGSYHFNQTITSAEARKQLSKVTPYDSDLLGAGNIETMLVSWCWSNTLHIFGHVFMGKTYFILNRSPMWFPFALNCFTYFPSSSLPYCRNMPKLLCKPSSLAKSNWASSEPPLMHSKKSWVA